MSARGAISNGRDITIPKIIAGTVAQLKSTTVEGISTSNRNRSIMIKSINEELQHLKLDQELPKFNENNGTYHFSIIHINIASLVILLLVAEFRKRRNEKKFIDDRI